MTDRTPPMPARPSPKPRRNFAVIAAASLSGVACLAMIAMVVVFIGVYAGHDRIELLESDEIYAAIETPCAELSAQAKSRPVVGTSEQRADALLDLVAAGEPLVTALKNLDPEVVESDLPTADWTKDWATLLESVHTYANRLKTDAGADFTMPLTADGYSIVGRMDWAGHPDCTVPKSFSTLDPTAKLPQEVIDELGVPE